MSLKTGDASSNLQPLSLGILESCSQSEESKPQSEESKPQEDTTEKLKYEESSASSPYVCSICKFQIVQRRLIVEHLILHITPNETVETANAGHITETGREMVNTALEQLGQIHKEQIAFPSADDHENDVEEPGVRTPIFNAQGQPKKYSCRKCGFKTVTKIEQWAHTPIHVKPEKLLYCYKCPFVTEYRHHLGFHLMNHIGLKPYKCTKEDCTYTCVNLSMLNSHRKSHSNVYPFSCKDCSYAAKYYHTFKQHLRKHKHNPAPRRNDDGTFSEVEIDIYGTRRGPRQKSKSASRPTSTSTASETEKSSENTIAQVADVGYDSDNSNDDSNDGDDIVQQPRTTSPQPLPPTETSTPAPTETPTPAPTETPTPASTETPTPGSSSQTTSKPMSFAFSTLANIFNMKNDNPVRQNVEPTTQQMSSFRFSPKLLTTLNTKVQQLMPTGGFVFGERTHTTTSAPQNTGDAGEEVVMVAATTNVVAVRQPEFFEHFSAENQPAVGRNQEELEQFYSSENMPLDLTSGSLKKKHNTSCQLSCRQASASGLPRNEPNTASSQLPFQQANPAYSQKPSAANKRRKGVAVKLQIAPEDDTTDEESAKQSGKRLCQSSSPTPSSAPPSTLISATPEDAPNPVGPTQEREQQQTAATEVSYMCVHCGIPYPDVEMYNAHMSCHGQDDPFTCNLCNRPYGDRKRFVIHIHEKCANHG
ncbi:PREDICTED: protein hunchback-like [Dinoponera quadriceps]|uniref:Protein hunchback-like n=1 Tax=Dinoponera quadriceps TaxID=609295 RepID=A0A6P3WX36_DINQU|nr:PREDICTED: protein hunchback-like [Dinoponera quadriceps]